MRYSALKAHESREQGPSTDIQSVILVVAEMISGRLPWRSIMSLRVIRELKVLFPQSQEFRRLPKEMRALYKFGIIAWFLIFHNIGTWCWLRHNHRLITQRFRVPSKQHWNDVIRPAPTIFRPGSSNHVRINHHFYVLFCWHGKLK